MATGRVLHGVPEDDWTTIDFDRAKLIFRVLVDHGSPISEFDLKQLVARKRGVKLSSPSATGTRSYSIGWAYPYLRRTYGIGRLVDWRRGTDDNRYVYFLRSQLDRIDIDLPSPGRSLEVSARADFA